MSEFDVIGLIPCGGYATRISPLPCSKEILPVALQQRSDGSIRPKVVSQFLLEQMAFAGVKRTLLVLRKGKWDIPDYYGDGSSLGMTLGYLIVQRPYGPPFTLDQAYPFVRGARVAMGFPDILFGPRDIFSRALARLTETHADLVLILCPVREIRVSDMIAVDPNGKVRDLVIKPKQTKLRLGWVSAVWTSAFTEFMHQYLSVPRTSAQQSGADLPPELTVGHVIQAAVRMGLPTQSVTFPGEAYLDIGTPSGLATALTGNRQKQTRGRK